MARVNLIPPILLTDQHLMAKKREINVIADCFKKSWNSSKGIVYSEIPDRYNLNQNHIKFFYDKRFYLMHRFDIVVEELKVRNYKLNTPFYDTWRELAPDQLHRFNTPFEADLEAYKIISQRILERILLKPEWYKYYHKQLNYEEYENKLFEFLSIQPN